MTANIQLTKRNMTVVDGYFFSFNESSNVLFEITADGTTAFSYPLDNALDGAVLSTEHDGVNFWTLEDGTVSGQDVIIKRWIIDNYVCKLQQTINKIGDASHKYSSEAFTVEHYHTTITGTTYSGGSYTIGMQPGYGTKLTSGMKVTLGPNTAGYSETIAVASAVDGTVTLQDPTTYAYIGGDSIQFYTDIWLFNNYDETTANAGALYNLNAYTGSLITKYPGTVYASIKGSTFFNVDSFSATYGIVDTLAYVKASNLLFVNIEPSGGSLSYYGSMAMDNVAAGGSSIYTVYDLAMDEKNVFRLQDIDGGNNYRLSTLESLVASIAVESDQAILPANELATTVVTATVKDQFFQPVAGRQVTFSEDEGSTAYFTTANPVNTNSDGIATITYRAGSAADEVVITATVQQS